MSTITKSQHVYITIIYIITIYLYYNSELNNILLQ